MEWGYAKQSIWVDLETSILSIGSDVGVTMSIQDRKIILTAGTGFETYTTDESWLKIVHEAQIKL